MEKKGMESERHSPQWGKKRQLHTAPASRLHTAATVVLYRCHGSSMTENRVTGAWGRIPAAPEKLQGFEFLCVSQKDCMLYYRPIECILW